MDNTICRLPLSQSLTRWVLAALLAIICVLAISKLMTSLITPLSVEAAIYKFLSIDFIRIEANSSSAPEQEEELPPPEEAEPAPPKPKLIDQAAFNPRLPKLSLDLSPIDTPSVPLSLSPPEFPANSLKPIQSAAPSFDEQLFPLLTPDPLYPRRAKRARLEGWVNISFTIGLNGSVSDVQVLSAEPEGIFENNTIRAVKNWKFKPQLLGGKPSARRVVQTIHFALEK